MITVAAASPAVDKLLCVRELQRGSIHRPHDQVTVPGGKGLNVARVARALGADVQVVGIVAGPAGEWVSGALEALGVPARWVWTDGETRTCTSVAEDARAGELTEFYEVGPVVGPETWRDYCALVEAQARSGEWLAVSGSLPAGAPLDGFGSLVGGHPGPGAVDTSGEALSAATSAGAGLVKVNAAEAMELLGRQSPGDVRSLPLLARDLRRHCGETAVVVVTGGRDGAVMSAPGELLSWASLPASGRYPVGSGDAFLAGLLAAREGDESWPSALRLATATAVANAEVPGPGILDLDRVARLRPLVDVKEVWA